MIKEAMNWIKDHGEKQVQEIKDGERRYLSQAVHELKPPSAKVLCLKTLSGLTTFIENKVDKFDKSKMLIHVVNYDEVHLYGPLGEVWRSREKYACVSLPQTDGFEFGTKMNHEDFVVALQTNFQETEDLKKVLALVGSMKSGKIHTSADDGVSQTVETSMGVQLASEKEIPNPVHLRPFRTFRDLDDQPESKFVLRVHQRDEELPRVALYEADGGAWVIDAVDKVRDYLKSNLDGVEIIS